MISGRMEEKRNELFEDVVEQVGAQLLEFGLEEKAASIVANQVADMLADLWGGQNLSIPKDYRRKLSARELEAYQAFTGDNIDQVAKAYGMTERGMRKMINRVRDRLRHQARNAPDLFEQHSN